MLILNRLDDYTPPMTGPSNEEWSMPPGGTYLFLVG